MNRNSNLFRFIKYFKPYTSRIIESAILMFSTSLLELPLPLITMFIIDDVIVERNYGLLNLLCFALFGILLLRLVSGFAQGYLLEYFRQRVSADLRMNLFNHILKLPLSFYKETQSGYMMSRVLNDISATHGLFADTILNILRSSLTLLFGTAIIFIINWRLAFLSIVFLPLFIFSILFFSKRIRSMSKETQERFAKVSLVLSESLQASEVVKSFGREKGESLKFFSKVNQFIKQSVETFLLGRTAGTFTSFIGGVAPLLILFYGGKEIMDGNLTIGGFVAFNSFLGYLYGPVQNLIGANLSIQGALGAVDRIFEILNKEKEDFDKGKILNHFKGEISIKKLSFSYDGKNKILDNISLDIYPGEKIGIAGESGSGKTTLVNLLLRLYEIKEGEILIDGINTKDISLKSLRENIGIVHQETFLFTGKISENIRYGRQDTKEKEIEEVAKIANLHNFIITLPHGYETEVGERGMKLSGGERQRIAIARMILKNPSIIILDEATSHLDYKNEKEIFDTLFTLFRGKTFIIITHRIFSLEIADRIVIIDKGRIVNIGNSEMILNEYQIASKVKEEKILIH
ncbi:MAG: ABC transporter ATP-binding protein [Acidobacteriota bacterium]